MILKVGDRINVMKYERHIDRINPVRVFKDSGFFQDFQVIRHDDGESSIHVIYMTDDGSLRYANMSMVMRVASDD